MKLQRRHQIFLALLFAMGIVGIVSGQAETPTPEVQDCPAARIPQNKLVEEQDWSYCNLFNSDLEDGVLTEVTMAGANLTASNLSGATLTRVDLSGANLTGANLTGIAATVPDVDDE